ncbi:MAG: translation initiation factor IF-2 [Paludibacteraceae bacterium]|nr:translation initiation factor IF-2 [Paludibacteraceae bacterium]
MAIKLIKACKELNIGMSTAVEFCAKQGKEIQTDPNVRIDDDLYLLLAKEFNKDMALKLEAEKQAQERQEREIPQKVSIDEPKAPEHIATEIPKPKVVGKIDLNPAAPEPEQAKKKEAVKEPEPVKEEPKQEPQEPKEKKDAEIFKLRKPELKNQPKVVGKIDLGSINQATHPTKKSKEEKKREREERQQLQQQQNAQAAEKRKRERIKQNKVDINDARNQKGSGKNKQKKGFKVEINDEEVQRQIKETLNRLQGQKGKTLTSKHKRERREQEREKMAEAKAEEQAQSKVLKLTEFVTANDLAVMMNIPVNKIIGACMMLGIMVSINQRLDAETINLVAEEFGFTTEYVSAHVTDEINADEQINDEDIEPRCPIVTVMGHVDHGKTSLLDHIRNTNVIAGEAGGITQHIGAYNVKLKNGQHITFLDTPGHEAFTAMRARGAKVTDIAIIIVAADDAVMPQTIEAINHAQAAGVPMIFAINKCDKPGANPDKIKEQLSNMNILVEDWGGKYQSQDISAKNGTGVYELLEKVLLEAEMLELKANPKRRAKGSIIESSLDKGRGYVATVLVSDGTLHMGDIVLAGTYHGKIKAMFNERGQKIQQALPGEPCLILGLNGAPQAGDEFNVLPTEQEARDIANKREQLQREQSIRTKKHVGLDEIGRRLAIGDFKELNIIVKGDVDGSVEALTDSLIKLSTENIQVNVIHGAVGAISDSDVLLAAASNAIIVGFNVRPTSTARKMAENEEVDIRIYSIIYDTIEEIKAAMSGMLSPDIKENVTASLEVLQTFHISKVGTIAGCIVREGKAKRTNKVRLIRDGIVIHTGEILALKHGKDDIKEIGVNQECGISIKSYNDIKEGDIIETFEQVEVAKTL